MIIQNPDITAFRKLSPFADLKDFNTNVEKWLADHKKVFTPTELIAIKRLQRFSAKVFGVCNARLNTLVKASIDKKDNYIGFSRSTLKRAIKKACEIGMLKKKATVRPQSNAQSSNLYIFQPYQVVSDSQTIELGAKNENKFKDTLLQGKVVKQLNPLKTSNIFKTNTIKLINTYNKQAIKDFRKIEKQKILKPHKNSLFTKIKNLLIQYNMQQDINEFSKIIFGSIKKYSKLVDSKIVENIIFRAFLDVMSTKESSIKKNRFAMLSGFIKRNMDHIISFNNKNSTKISSEKPKFKSGIKWLDNGDHRKTEKVVLTQEQKNYYELKRKEIMAKLNIQ